jgi:tripartite-type tricarboxylate transporter receptor subunit TctC
LKAFFDLAAPVGNALLAPTTSAGAMDWPTRPVTVIVPLAAGGSADLMARLGTERFAARFRQPRLRPWSNLEEGAFAQIVAPKRSMEE